MYSRFILQKLLKAKGQEINQRQKTKTKKNATYILIAAPQLQKQMSVGLLWKTVSVFSQGMISHEVFNLIMRSAFKDENTQQQINDWKKIKKISVVSVTSSDLGQIELGDIYRISTITMYSFQISWSLLICLKTPPIWDHMTVNWKITLSSWKCSTFESRGYKPNQAWNSNFYVMKERGNKPGVQSGI